MKKYLAELKEQGFNGVQNFPTVGLIDGTFRKNLEETGMGYGLEVDMIAEAHKLDMLTCPYVFDEEQAAAMTKAGADIIVAHMGLTTGGTIGAETARTLEDCAKIIEGIVKVVKDINPDALVICHGGPISEPKDAAYIIENVPGIDGFFGATSIERLASRLRPKHLSLSKSSFYQLVCLQKQGARHSAGALFHSTAKRNKSKPW